MDQAMTTVVCLEPAKAQAYVNLGLSRSILGDGPAADRMLSRALHLDPILSEAHEQRGRLHLADGRGDEAVAAARRAATLAPERGGPCEVLGGALLTQNRPAEAVRVLSWATRLAPRRPMTAVHFGRALDALGRGDAALKVYARALTLQPDLAVAHFKRGAICQGQNALELALRHYERAIACDPGMAAAYANRGLVLANAGHVEAGVRSLRQAETLAPTASDIWLQHLDMLDARNDRDALRETLRQAVARCGQTPLLSIIQAKSLRRQGDLEGARRVLAWPPDARVDLQAARARAFVLGGILDRQGDTAGAFKAFLEANALARRMPGFARQDPSAYLRSVQARQRWITSDEGQSWVAEPFDEDGRADPVFLVGFPRSGTTLLDTILMAHSSTVVLDEKDMLDCVKRDLKRVGKGDVRVLPDLRSDDIARMRRIYFEAVSRHAGRAVSGSAVIVDKNPLHMVEAALAHRIFPRAKFILAIRHPCDCVLSCFMQDFGASAAMASFLTLEGGARLYDGVMDLWHAYARVLPLPIHVLRYESLIESFEDTARPLLAFLGLPWEEALRHHTRTARQRGRINTPSYDQVTQPLYKSAMGRWHRYREAMEPVLPLLRPWVRHFGYEDL